MASSVEMLSGKRKNDYAAESAAEALAAQAAALGVEPSVSAFGPTAIATADVSSEEEELVAA